MRLVEKKLKLHLGSQSVGVTGTISQDNKAGDNWLQGRSDIGGVPQAEGKAPGEFSEQLCGRGGGFQGGREEGGRLSASSSCIPAVDWNSHTYSRGFLNFS
jgi:hypothetical protein